MGRQRSKWRKTLEIDNAVALDRTRLQSRMRNELCSSSMSLPTDVVLDEFSVYARCHYLQGTFNSLLLDAITGRDTVSSYKAVIIFKYLLLYGPEDLFGFATWNKERLMYRASRLSKNDVNESKVLQELTIVIHLLDYKKTWKQERRNVPLAGYMRSCGCSGCVHDAMESRRKTKTSRKRKIHEELEDPDDYETMLQTFGWAPAPPVCLFSDICDMRPRGVWRVHRVKAIIERLYGRNAGEVKTSDVRIVYTRSQCEDALSILKACPCLSSAGKLFEKVFAFDCEFVSDAAPYRKWNPMFQFRSNPTDAMKEMRGPFARWIAFSHACGKTLIVDTDDRFGDATVAEPLLRVLNDPKYTVISWAGRCDACALRNTFGANEFSAVYDLQALWKRIRQIFGCNRNRLGIACQAVLGAEEFSEHKDSIIEEEERWNYRNYWGHPAHSPYWSPRHLAYISADAVALYDLFVAISLELPALLKYCRQPSVDPKMKSVVENVIGAEFAIPADSVTRAPGKALSEDEPMPEVGVSLVVEEAVKGIGPGTTAESTGKTVQRRGGPRPMRSRRNESFWRRRDSRKTLRRNRFKREKELVRRNGGWSCSCKSKTFPSRPKCRKCGLKQRHSEANPGRQEESGQKGQPRPTGSSSEGLRGTPGPVGQNATFCTCRRQ